MAEQGWDIVGISTHHRVIDENYGEWCSVIFDTPQNTEVVRLDEELPR